MVRVNRSAFALDRRTSRRLAQLVAVGRVGLGILAIVAPQVPLRPWVGERSGDPGALLLARGLGARDLALGLGTVLALRQDGPVRGWVEAGGLADAGDTLFTLQRFGHLPSRGRWLVLTAAAGATVAAGLAARGVDGRAPGQVVLAPR